MKRRDHRLEQRAYEKRRDRILKDARSVKIGDPWSRSGFVYVEPPPDFDAIEKRGALWFDILAETGYHTQRVRTGQESTVQIMIWKPWTYVYAPVGVNNFEPIPPMKACSILDVHFPLMSLEDAVVNDNQEYLSVVENRSRMIEQLRSACAVTCPNPKWAAELTEVLDGKKVWLLPDLTLDNVSEFGMAFNDICAGIATTHTYTIS